MNTSEIATTRRQRDIMEHAVSADERRRYKLSRKTRLHPREFRNYYCASVGGSDDAEIIKLCEAGLMRKGPTINDGREYYAYVTESGLKEVGL